MTIPRNLSFLAEGASSTGVLGTANGGTGLNTLGTAGQALVVNSGATGLTYSTPSAGAMTLISTQTPTGTTGVAWSGLSGYTSYVIMLADFNNNGFATPFELLIGSGGTIATSGYSSGGIYRTSTTISGVTNSTTSYIDLILSSTNSVLTGIINIQCISAVPFVLINANLSTNNSINYIVSGGVSSLSSISDIQIKNNGSHNFTFGTASLYGIST